MNSLQKYITICPTGLEKFAIDAIYEVLTSSSKQYICHNITILNNSDLTIDEERIKIQEYKTQLVNQIQKKKAKQEAKRNKSRLKTSVNQTENGLKHETDHSTENNLHGSIQVKHLGHVREICIGYHKDETILSSPGGLEGKKLISFQTNAPPKIVASIRPMGCGPLMAVVLNSSDIRSNREQKIFHIEKSLDDTVSSFSTLMSEVGIHNYKELFSNAMQLWSRHVSDVWLESKDVHDFHIEQTKKDDCTLDITQLRKSLRLKLMGQDVCRYRVSSIRSYTKEYTYKREDIIPLLVHHLIPKQTTIMNSTLTGVEKGEPMTFAVDLKNYDFELVLIIHEDIFSVAISLCPYQYIGARSFSSGKLPADITPPYITGEVSNTIVRLRPSIASLLCHISKIEKGDIILDPCAGIGSIPIEGSLLGGFRTCFALGGDIAIKGSSNDGLNHIVTNYVMRARKYQNHQSCSGGCDMVSWDASSLPIRDSTVDCIISDLPFGVKCLSSKMLHRFLPLLFSECARLLRKKTGRMTLLCGSSYKLVLDAITQQVGGEKSHDPVFDVRSVFPVNIGGHSAWIVQAIRNEIVATKIQNHTARHKKMTMGREQQQRQGVKRRLQA